GFKFASRGTLFFLGSFSNSRQETFPNALRDFDGDGIPDFPCMDGQPNGCNHYFNDRVGGVLFGNGGGFNRISSCGDARICPHDACRGPTMYHYRDGSFCSGGCNDEYLGRTARVSETEDHGPPYGVLRRIWRDYIDLDGDGMPERYVLHVDPSGDTRA